MPLTESVNGSIVPTFIDRRLRCSICNQDFTFTADEQLFFFEQGFEHAPKRCKRCMANRRTNKSRVRTETQTKCAICGTTTTVPFIPTQGRPVFCHSCFKSQGTATAAVPMAVS